LFLADEMFKSFGRNQVSMSSSEKLAYSSEKMKRFGTLLTPYSKVLFLLYGVGDEVYASQISQHFNMSEMTIAKNLRKINEQKYSDVRVVGRNILYKINSSGMKAVEDEVKSLLAKVGIFESPVENGPATDDLAYLKY